MSDAAQSFGRKLLSQVSVEDSLTLEAKSQLSNQFSALDSLIHELVTSAVEGRRIARAITDKVRGSTVVTSLSETSRQALDEIFALEHQRARGAWYLPDEVALEVGLANLVWYFQNQPRFALGISSEDRVRVKLGRCPDALCFWALLQPFLELLWLPLQLRGPLSGTLSREDFEQRWQTVLTFYKMIGLQCKDDLRRFDYGTGWHKLSASEQVDERLNLVSAVRTHYSAAVASRFRMYQLRKLAARYYLKADSQGQAERRKVLARAYQPLLSGIFAGDWLAFLRYLGESPHSNEQIATGLPRTRLYVTDTSKAAAVARVEKVPVAEIERIVSTFWDRPGQVMSPIEERVAVLGRYWTFFQDIHAHQKSGMQSLLGLLGSRSLMLHVARPEDGPSEYDLYHSVLPKDLLTSIEQLWSGLTLASYPEIVVTEIFPHALMAETFGPALRFWHGCSLTAWFIAEGPFSRTDMAGLQHYYRRELAELEDVGCSIDQNLFASLIALEASLGPPQPIEQERSTAEAGEGFSLSISLTVGSRRGGFENLRDVITQHRDEWAAKHLERYLRARWERQLTYLSEHYSRVLSEKGRGPTLKQFAKVAGQTANQWFGGDLAGVYGAIGEKVAERPLRRAMLPPDRLRFARVVYKALGGRPIEGQTAWLHGEQARTQRLEQQRNSSLAELAGLSLQYVQLQEALGRPPSVEEFGHRRFEGLSRAVANTLDEAWSKYADVIRTVLESRLPPWGPRTRCTDTEQAGSTGMSVGN